MFKYLYVEAKNKGMLSAVNHRELIDKYANKGWREFMKIKRYLLYIIAAVCMIGGIMGIVKGILPDMEWLNFRYLLHGDGTYEIGKMPVYARIYGIIMGCLEIIVSTIIFKWEKRLFVYAKAVLIINMIGCIVAFVLGDMFAIVSLILRFIPLYLLVREEKYNV